MARQKVSRWHVASRVFAATIVGFILTNSTGILLTFILPLDKISAVAVASVLSFVLWAAIILWVFSVERLRTVWLTLVTAIAVTGGGAWVMYTLEAAS
ncbi:MAG: hypothetical protein AAF725_22910 [Acidobacteriota bacterium]